MNLEPQTNLTGNAKDNIYITSGGEMRILERAAIKKYISTICDKIGANELDVDKITNNVYPKLKTVNTIDEVEEQIVACASEMVVDHYDYPKIATWILITNLHKSTETDYVRVVEQLQSNINKKGVSSPIVTKEFADYVKKHQAEINAAICYEHDFDLSVFGFRTLEKAYLKKFITGQIIERPQHMFMRVAIAIHYRKNALDKIIETYDLLSRGFFTHATPTLFNAGTQREQLSSCFLLGVDDDMGAIGDCWKDCAVISKYAGGIAVHATRIRVSGAYIHSTQGTASGLRLLTVFNQIARYADQGGKRAGSIAVYIEPWHGDIFFFLDLKKNTGAETERARDLFLGLMINDIFMHRVESDGMWSLMCPSECPDLLDKFGDEFTAVYERYESEGRYLKQFKARDLWFRIMESQIETGVPYIIYKDAANSKSNQKNIGVINGSNLCVAGDTKILTSSGYFSIKSLVDRKVEVWNGEEFSEVTIKKTGENQKLMQISFSNGSVLKCTPYHKFYLVDGARNQKMVKIDASELKIGDKLIKVSYPVIEEGRNDFKYPYTHGLFCADGTYNRSKEEPRQCSFAPSDGSIYCNRHINQRQFVDKKLIKNKDLCQALVNLDKPMLSLYVEKQELLGYLDVFSCGDFDLTNNKLNTTLYYDIAEKYTVPINYNIDIKLRWLEGLLDGDGTICVNGSNISLQISSISKSFLNKVKYMLQTIGCDAKVTLSQRAGKTLMPDGKGGNKLYDRQNIYRLLINSCDTYDLVKLGLNPHRIDIQKMDKPQRSASQFIKITAIKKLKEKENTYCFTEPKRGMGIFNGIITGNCAEILEVSSSDSYSVCNLASICLPKYVEFTNGKPTFNYHMLYKVSRIVTRNLDNIIDINYYPVEKTRPSNMNNRPIGIGVQGLADVFAMFKTPFDSEIARDLNRKIFETIYFGALSESMQLAKECGHYATFEGSPMSKGLFQFDLWNFDYSKLSGMWNWEALRADIMKFGVRNSLVTACMPTASTSQIMNNNECFEPYTENIYTRTTLAGDFYVINKYLMQDLKELGLWDSNMLDLIKYFEGSIARIDGIPEHIKAIYRTVWEIPQKSLVEMDADRGPFVDQTQSSNRFIAKPNFVKLTSVLFYAWRLGLKTGMYYLRSKAASEANKFGIDIDKIKEIEAKYGINNESSGFAPVAKKTPSSGFVCPIDPKEREACEFCSA